VDVKGIPRQRGAEANLTPRRFVCGRFPSTNGIAVADPGWKNYRIEENGGSRPLVSCGGEQSANMVVLTAAHVQRHLRRTNGDLQDYARSVFWIAAVVSRRGFTIRDFAWPSSICICMTGPKSLSQGWASGCKETTRIVFCSRAAQACIRCVLVGGLGVSGTAGSRCIL